MQARGAQMLDGAPHARHRRGHQRGQADDLCAVRLHRLHHARGRHVAAQVDDVEAVVFQHRAHDVLADVVDIALHRCQHDRALALALCAGLLNRPAHLVEGCAGRTRRVHQLRQEDLLSLIALANQIERRNQMLLHQMKRRNGFEHLGRDGPGLRLHALGNRLADRELHRRIGDRGLLFLLRRGMAPDVCRAGDVLAAEHAARVDRIHHLLLVGIEDGHRQTREDCLCEKRLRDQLALRQTKGDVRHAQHRLQPQLLVHDAHGLKRPFRLLLLGRDRQRQAVDRNVLSGNARPLCLVHNPFGKIHALLRRSGQTAFPQRQRDDGCAVFFGQRQHAFKRRARGVHTVDQTLARRDAKARFNRCRVRRVDLQRQGHCAGDSRHHAAHHLRLIHAR